MGEKVVYSVVRRDPFDRFIKQEAEYDNKEEAVKRAELENKNKFFIIVSQGEDVLEEIEV